MLYDPMGRRERGWAFSVYCEVGTKAASGGKYEYIIINKQQMQYNTSLSLYIYIYTYIIIVIISCHIISYHILYHNVTCNHLIGVTRERSLRRRAATARSGHGTSRSADYMCTYMDYRLYVYIYIYTIM